MRQSEILYMDFEVSLRRTQAILAAIATMADGEMDETQLRHVVNLAELGECILSDQLQATLEEEAREAKKRKKKPTNHAVAVQENHRHNEQTL